LGRRAQLSPSVATVEAGRGGPTQPKEAGLCAAVHRRPETEPLWCCAAVWRRAIFHYNIANNGLLLNVIVKSGFSITPSKHRLKCCYALNRIIPPLIQHPVPSASELDRKRHPGLILVGNLGEMTRRSRGTWWRVSRT
jgi:hypothetical protein